MSEKEIIVYGIFGIPGSGKSTQGRLLEADKELNIIHVTTGAIFKYIRKKNENKELIAKMDACDATRSLYSDEDTARELDNYINNRIEDGTFDSKKQIILLDGYPRNLNQVKMMEGKYRMTKCAILDLSEDVALERIINVRNKNESRPEDKDPEKVKKSIHEHKQNLNQIINNFFRYRNPYNPLPQIKYETRYITAGPQITYTNADRPIDTIHIDLKSFFKA